MLEICTAQINTCHSNATPSDGPNVVEAFKNNSGFRKISGASGGVSYPFGKSPFAWVHIGIIIDQV